MTSGLAATAYPEGARTLGRMFATVTDSLPPAAMLRDRRRPSSRLGAGRSSSKNVCWRVDIKIGAYTRQNNCKTKQ